MLIKIETSTENIIEEEHTVTQSYNINCINSLIIHEDDPIYGIPNNSPFNPDLSFNNSNINPDLMSYEVNIFIPN